MFRFWRRERSTHISPHTAGNLSEVSLRLRVSSEISSNLRGFRIPLSIQIGLNGDISSPHCQWSGDSIASAAQENVRGRLVWEIDDGFATIKIGRFTKHKARQAHAANMTAANTPASHCGVKVGFNVTIETVERNSLPISAPAEQTSWDHAFAVAHFFSCGVSCPDGCRRQRSSASCYRSRLAIPRSSGPGVQFHQQRLLPGGPEF